MRGKCDKPKSKKRSNIGSIHLTHDVFRFDKHEDNVTRLWVRAKRKSSSAQSLDVIGCELLKKRCG